jgi:hypothetical protein
MNILIKLFTLLITLVALPTPVYAEMVDQKKLMFDIKPDALLKGDIHYSFSLSSARELLDSAPDLQDLDASGIFKDQDTKILFNKIAYIVKKPVGFFDHKQVIAPDYLKHVMKGQEVVALKEGSFKITTSGVMGYSYKLDLFYDSDDVSTLPQKRATQVVTNSKRFDVISQSAHSSIYRELTEFSKYTKNAISITHHIPMTDSKTLVITYNISAVKKFFAIEKIIRPNFLKETKSIKEATDSFKIQD